MARLALALTLLGLTTTCANADPTNLESGVFIAHYVPELGFYTTSPPPPSGWCGEYLAHFAISNVEEQNNRIDVATYLASSWFILAAWDEDKEWCGTEFGFGEYDPGLFGFVEYSPCFPEDGLELPTPGWPGPNEGIAFVVAGAPWRGNLVPVMHFGGYAYAYVAPGIVPLDVDPQTGFAGTADCLYPSSSFAAAGLGGMGINMDGIYSSPPDPLAGVCCEPDSGGCHVILEEECLAMGWHWRPDLGQSCSPNPCPQPPPEGVCCFGDGSCAIMTQAQCEALGGTWHGARERCDPNPCPQPGVCCCGPECFIALEHDCLAMDCHWHPEWVSCVPENPCEIYTGTGKKSWGAIKAIYR